MVLWDHWEKEYNVPAWGVESNQGQTLTLWCITNASSADRHVFPFFPIQALHVILTCQNACLPSLLALPPSCFNEPPSTRPAFSIPLPLPSLTSARGESADWSQVQGGLRDMRFKNLVMMRFLSPARLDSVSFFCFSSRPPLPLQY